MTPSTTTERGFTLIEMLLAVAIGITVTGIAIASIPSFVKQAKADGGLAEALSAFKSARELSVGDRRNVQLIFSGSNTIQVRRVDVPGPGTTLMRTIVMEGRVTFLLTAGLPDTPDAFGKASATAFGTATPPMFTTDGSLVDANGDVLNGTLFLGVSGDPLSARAITIFGPTGLMRIWKWDGRQWTEV